MTNQPLTNRQAENFRDALATMAARTTQLAEDLQRAAERVTDTTDLTSVAIDTQSNATAFLANLQMGRLTYLAAWNAREQATKQ